MNMLEKLKEYFENTPRKKVLEDWERSGFGTEGIESPTIEEFLTKQTKDK